MTAPPDPQPPGADPDHSADEARPVRLGMADPAHCRRRVHLDHDPDADRSRRRPPDAGLQLRFDALDAHRRAIAGRLAVLAVDGEYMTVPSSQAPTDRPLAVRQPRLVTQNRYATPDLLLRATDGGYLPVLIRGHRTTDPGAGAVLTDLDELCAWGTSYLSTGGAPIPVRDGERKLRSHPNDVLALAHVYRILAELGLASGEKLGGIIGFGGPATDPDWDDGALIVWHRLDGAALDEYDERFADRLAVATAAARRLPALALPSRIGECRRCPWWTVCGPELEAAHDISLLVSGADVAVLREAGARSFDDVAAMAPEVLAALPLTAIPPAEARIRARALVAGVPVVRRGEVTDAVRADVELDVDMESYGDDGAYLWGTYLSGVIPDGFTAGYRAFVTWEPLQTPATATNFVSFWRYVQSLRKACAGAGLTFAAFCYSRRAEERWLYGTPERFPGEPGMPDRAEIAEFCSSPQWVDLYAEMRRLFVVPGSMRLKALAPIAGFAWRDPEPGGENSMAWYRAALGEAGVSEASGAPDAPGAPDASGLSQADIATNRQRILRYNEDDVLATVRLRQWICEGSGEMPTVAELAAR